MSILPRFLRCARRHLAALAFSTALLPVALHADPVRLTDDAGINTTGTPATTGADPSFAVKGKPGKAKESVGYLKFDLSDLPAGTLSTNVGKATLRVFVDAATKEGGTFNVVAVTGAWSEDGINASNAPSLGAVVASNVVAGPEQAQNFLSVDITPLVQQWLAGTLVNNGVALVPGNSNVAATFDTKESTTTSHAATLDVSLLSASATGATGPQGPQGVQGLQGTVGPAGPTSATGLGAAGKYLQVRSPLGGGGGGGSGAGFGGLGGGAFEVIAQGAITLGSGSSITANGANGTTGGGGGAGGLVVLVSGTSITATTTNSINATGGAGGAATNAISGGGGGGGGIIHLYAPTISVSAPMAVASAGASAVSVTITAAIHGSGGGGGSLGGFGAFGGSAALNQTSSVNTAQNGNVFQSLVTDPSSLF